ncbi:hypothetical protein BH20VER1_BH20VER1_19880 [soil metagenome]
MLKQEMIIPFSRPSLVTLASLALSLFAAGAARAQQLVRVPADHATVQEAIAAVANGGVIEISQGTYVAPAGGFTVLDYGKSFTMRAATGAAVTLSGGSNTDILRIAESPGRARQSFRFERLKFASGASTHDFIGGAVTLARTDAVFVGCDFESNTANGSITGGGALWLDDSVVSFNQCTWTNNSSRNYGGAIAAVNSRVFLRDSSFVGNRVNLPNHSPNAAGGAIFNSDSLLRIDNCRFENNQAGYVGGAIYCGGGWREPLSTPTIDLTVSNSLFIGNFAAQDASVPAISAPLGGAVHIEDQITGTFTFCRFVDNHAFQGGAISSYRAVTKVEGCEFRGNYVGGTTLGESLGGAIIALSDDNPDASTNGGTINRRSTELEVRDTLFQGAGPLGRNALQGGAIFVAGDLNATYGRNGITINGTPESNRAKVTLTRVAFADLVTTGGAYPGSAGALAGAFAQVSIEDSIVQNCSTTHLGGGLQFVQSSDVTIKRTTIVGCRAGSLGGGLAMFGGTLSLQNSNLIENQSTGSGLGAAMVSAPAPASDGLPGFDITGEVQDCVLSNNTGSQTIWEGDRVDPPFNRLQYSRNRIFTSGTVPFYSQISGDRSVAQMNSLTIPRSDGTTTVKAPTANTAPASAPQVGALLMVPPMTSPTGAPGETLPIPAYLAYAGSGAPLVLDGATQTAPAGVVQTLADTQHTLTVGNSTSTTTPPPGVALNISTRLPVLTGDDILIGGFIILGPNPKQVIVRAIGPSLVAAGLAGVLQDPVLELFAGPTRIATNNNWRTTELGGAISSPQAVDLEGFGIGPTSAAESAMLVTLAPGAYTALVRGVNNGTGIGLVEVFDVDPIATSYFANISTRGFVQTSDNVMIGGFIYLGGNGPTSILVRAIGPSTGLANALADPTLQLVNSNGAVIAENDDWRETQAAEIIGTGAAPNNDREAAILQTSLPRGAYTAIVRGKNGGTGVGLVEVFVIR